MKTAWLPEMPINVATMLLDPRLASESDAKIGRLIRVLSRAWITGGLGDVPASIRPLAESFWPDYAELRAKLHEKHRALSEAGARGGRPPKERGAERGALGPLKRGAESEAESTHPNPHPHPYPQPDPQPHPQPVVGRRGSRLPDDAVLTGEWVEIAQRHGVRDVDAVFTEFVNYWTSLPGQRATKLDWTKTWENQCIKTGGRVRVGDRPQTAAGRTMSNVDAMLRSSGAL